MNLSNLMPRESRKKISRLLCVTALSTCSVFVYAQQQQVKLTGSNLPLKSVFQQIEKQTDLSIDYRSQDVDDSRIVKQMPKATTVQQAMNQLLAGTDCVVTFTNGHIIIKKQASNTTNQQSKLVKGTIVDATGMPVIGANVMVKGTTNGTITDMDGNFSLEVDNNAILIVSYIGYSNQEIKVGSQTNLAITMKEDAEALDELVVVGYGTMKKKDITGAVSQVSDKLIKEVPVTNLNQALQGRAAGVQVQTSDNTPGGGISIMIRGKSSISQSNEPIYVVDGVIMQGTLNNINPNDIQSIDILKDASSAAIYGSRAANGVVIVTTKKGSAGVNRISYDGYVSVSQVLNKQEMLSAQQLADIRIEGMVNQEMDKVLMADPSISKDDYYAQWSSLKKEYRQTLPSFSDIERETLRKGETYDWFDQILQTAITQNHSVSFSGGTDKTSYYISGNYLNQEGIVVGSGVERFSGRINFDQKMKQWLKIGINATASHNKQDISGVSMDQALGANPLIPFEINGEHPLELPFYTSEGMPNPILSEKIDNEAISKRLSASAYAIVNLLPELEFKTNFSIDMVDDSNFGYVPRSIKQGQTTEGEATIKKESWIDWLWDNTVTYKKDFNEIHAFTGMLGLSFEKNIYEGNQSYGKGFATDLLSYKSIGGATDFPANSQWSNFSNWQTASFMMRLNYAYDNRYLFTFTGRYDGNSKYGVNNKWGFFPSAAVAWRISEEHFMDEASFLDDLKLRLGYGQLGNSNFSSYVSFTQIVPGVTSVGCNYSAMFMTHRFG